MSRHFYVMGPYENNDRHSICRDDPSGGDPLTIITIARIHRADELYELCRLASIDKRSRSDATVSVKMVMAEFDRLRAALGLIASKNDLSGVAQDEVEPAARHALHECEVIAREALCECALSPLSRPKLGGGNV